MKKLSPLTHDVVYEFKLIEIEFATLINDWFDVS